MRRLRAGAFAALALAASSHARAEGGCLDRPGPRPVLRQTVVMLLNPTGAEHQARLGVCAPLYASTSEALWGNHVELGASTYLSPVYAFVGPYFEIAPSSFFSLRVELTGVGVWPIPIGGAGYYPLSGPRATFRDADVPGDKGQSAKGWAAKVISGWGAKASLGKKAALLAGDALWLDHEELGGAAYYLDVRNDLVAARVENVVANEGAILLELGFGKTFFRVGPYDALRATPQSGYVGHQLGGMAMLELTDVSRAISSLAIWARLGGYTHHAIRAGEAATLAGLAIDWDLAGNKPDQ